MQALQELPPQAVLVDMVRTDEPWTEMFLADGSKIKARLIPTEVRRVPGHFTPDGNPLYHIGWQIVVHTVAPEGLRRS